VLIAFVVVASVFVIAMLAVQGVRLLRTGDTFPMPKEHQEAATFSEARKYWYACLYVLPAPGLTLVLVKAVLLAIATT
jgi:hypothetical protein